MKWRWLRGERTMAHCAPLDLEETVAAEMASRDAPFDRGRDDIVEFGIDMPGMARVGRPWETFDFHGLRVSMPSEDVASFAGDVEALEMREFGGRTFTKLKGFHRCLVLTPELRDELLATLRTLAFAAEQRAAVFYADKKPASEALREANAKANGVSVDEIPDCGGHKNDRFTPKNRGAA